MKITIYKWISIIIVLLTIGLQNTAHAIFIHEGIYYQIIGSNELEVISATDDYKTRPETPDSNNYTGDIFIPHEITIQTTSGGIIKYYVKQIGDNAFCNCELETVTISEGIENINFKAFYNTKVTNLILPYSLNIISDYAFMRSRIDELDIPTGVISIGIKAFAESDLKKIIIPNTVESIGEGITENCSKLEYLLFEDSTTTLSINQNHGYIGDLPSQYLYIGRNFDSLCHGFNNPRAIRQIEFGKYFSQAPFHHEFISMATSVEKIIVRNTIPPKFDSSDRWGSAYFRQSVYKNSTLYIPNGTIFNFKTADVWKNFQNIQMYDPEDPSVGITDTSSDKPKISVTGRDIFVYRTNATEVAVYALDGRVVYQGKASCIEIPAAGLYIVRTGNHTTKVLVK